MFSDAAHVNVFTIGGYVVTQDEISGYHVSTLDDSQLRRAYIDISGDVDVIDPLNADERGSILFGFATADIVYVTFVDGKWVNVTPEGEEGVASVVKQEDGSFRIKISPKPLTN